MQEEGMIRFSQLAKRMLYSCIVKIYNLENDPTLADLKSLEPNSSLVQALQELQSRSIESIDLVLQY